MRSPVAVAARKQDRTQPFPAPVRGWIENENLAANAGMGATVLENGFPLTSTVRIRGGALLVALVGSAAKGFITYQSGSVAKIFAASATDLYDISALNSTLTTPVLTQLGGGAFSFVQFGIAALQYVVAANGFDPLIYYDGTSWNPIRSQEIYNLSYDAKTASFAPNETLTGSTSGTTAVIVSVIPASATVGLLKIRGIVGTFVNNELINSASGSATANGTASLASSVTIDGVTTSTLSQIWMHGNRLWAVQKGTMSAWYLPVDQIGGTATEFHLGGEFSDGGSLLFGAAWSADSGSGFADRCVFVSDQGEIIVYEGTDPNTAGAWTKVGRYNIGRPLCPYAMKAGGDLLIATTDGIVPMSQIVTKDPAALSMAAVTYPIEPAWLRVARLTTPSVQMLKWQRESMGIIGLPHRGGLEAFAVNLVTGAWSKWTGLDVQCMALHNDIAYFGDASGKIYQFEATGQDNGAPYAFRYSGLPDHLGAPGAFKTVDMARATFRSLAPFGAKLSVATDYRKTFPAAPNVTADDADYALWDVALWDVAKWDDGPDLEERLTVTTLWRSIGVSGFSVAPQVQVTCGSARKPDAELVAFDMLYHAGGTVV